MLILYYESLLLFIVKSQKKKKIEEKNVNVMAKKSVKKKQLHFQDINPRQLIQMTFGKGLQ